VLASSHRAFATYAHRYGLRELPLHDAFGGEGALRPETFAEHGRRLEQAGATVLFPEQTPPERALQTLARHTGIPLAGRPLSADGLAPGRTTVGTFVDNTCTIVEALGGACDRQQGEALDRRWRAIPAVVR
jgi:zinc/manganese transport system substrate-binding protein